MSEATGPESIDHLDPAEAFAAIGNEIRLAILEAIWEADERPVAFSDLREAVEMRDSAQFNYHLQQLTDGFVVKVDSDESDADGGTSSNRRSDGGYDLRNAGEKVVRSVLAGTFNEHPTIAPFEIDADCIECGATLEARYADERLAVECPDCGKSHGRYSFPPGGLKERSKEELLGAFDDRVRHLHCLAADGVCPECSGRTHTEIVSGGSECDLDLEVHARHVCEHCGHALCSPVGLRFLDHSEVVSFYRDHGVSLSDRPYWTLEWCVDDEYTTVDPGEEITVEIRMPAGDSELRIVVDEDLEVRSTERVAVA
ncbi:MAG: DNA-binding transcriptional ArsR family regulator [Halobacteriales archaeon]|jgi:DNA-binding transcriptional ArsR family regulator